MPRPLRAVPVAVLMAGLLAGCGGSDTATTQAAPSATAVPTAAAPSSAAAPEVPTSAAPSSTGRAAATAACRALDAAMRAGTLAETGVVQAIVADAGRSSDVFLRAAAGRLSAAYRLFVKEKGKPTEAARVETLKKRGTDMLRSCRTGGITTP